jgi:hypothetical protein
MKFLNENPGESVYDFLNRALNMAHDEVITIHATHNSIYVVVYPQSCIYDLCDKYDMGKKLNESYEYYRTKRR